MSTNKPETLIGDPGSHGQLQNAPKTTAYSIILILDGVFRLIFMGMLAIDLLFPQILDASQSTQKTSYLYYLLFKIALVMGITYEFLNGVLAICAGAVKQPIYTIKLAKAVKVFAIANLFSAVIRFLIQFRRVGKSDITIIFVELFIRLVLELLQLFASNEIILVLNKGAKHRNSGQQA